LKRLATKLAAALIFVSAQTAVFAAVCFGAIGEDTTKSPDLGDPAGKPIVGGGAGDTFVMILKVIFFLILIIGLFFVIMKIVSQKNKLLFGRSIRSLGGVPLGQNKSIQIVEIGRSLYVVGVGENVQLLEKIEDEQEVAYITDLMTVSSVAPSFDAFGSWVQKLRGKPVDNELEETEMSFQQVFHNKMQRVSDRKKLAEELLNQDQYTDRLNDKS
jgi:flagellar protein FliO/FliZ